MTWRAEAPAQHSRAGMRPNVAKSLMFPEKPDIWGMCGIPQSIGRLGSPTVLPCCALGFKAGFSPLAEEGRQRGCWPFRSLLSVWCRQCRLSWAKDSSWGLPSGRHLQTQNRHPPYPYTHCCWALPSWCLVVYCSFYYNKEKEKC